MGKQKENNCHNCLFGNDELSWKYIYCKIEKCFTMLAFNWKAWGYYKDCENWKVKKVKGE